MFLRNNNLALNLSFKTSEMHILEEIVERIHNLIQKLFRCKSLGLQLAISAFNRKTSWIAEVNEWSEEEKAVTLVTPMCSDSLKNKM